MAVGSALLLSLFELRHLQGRDLVGVAPELYQPRRLDSVLARAFGAAAAAAAATAADRGNRVQIVATVRGGRQAAI